MNTAALKRFAPAVRRDLMEAVERKLDVALAAQTPDYRTTFAAQVAELRELARADRAGLVERVAYTWFNRLAALRYLDARGWHPFRARVLTPVTPEETQPELLKLARTRTLPEELRGHTDPARLDDLLDGRIPSGDAQGEVYRHLVLAACRYYHALLPDLFERLDDATELLLPDDLLTARSVAHGFRTDITDADCETVEVLGWLYQFYIAEKKDAVMARKSAVPSEDIPAVTQLFTPHWIVRYLVENSLGRLWLLNRPDSRLREAMPYYVEGEPETDFLRVERPEDIRLIDPAVGSGHMLTYGFDLLFSIYEEEGYAPTEIAGLILQHNLYGVDIDPRAAQLATLALTLKARERSRRFFQRDVLVRPNVIALQDVRFDEAELREYVRALDLGPLFDGPVLQLLRQFEHATTFGSLIEPVIAAQDLERLRRTIEEKDVGGQLLLSTTHLKVLRVLQESIYLAGRYQVAVTNPPYLGQMAARLKEFAKAHFPDSKTDLFAMFIRRSGHLALERGYVAMITMQSWMFLSSYEDMREALLDEFALLSLVHLGPRAFDSIGGEVVQTAAFVMQSAVSDATRGTFFRLIDGRSEAEKEQLYLEAISNGPAGRRFRKAVADFRIIPGAPIAYWLTPKVLRCFTELELLGDLVPLREGINTGDNARFLRYWHEIESAKRKTDESEAVAPSHKWVPHKKGGAARRWYGNTDFVLNWENGGRDIHAFHGLPLSYNGAPMRGKSYFFKSSLSWSRVSTGEFALRHYPSGFSYDSTAPSVFPPADRSMEILGLLNSSVARHFLAALCPTLDYRLTNVGRLPVRLPPTDAEAAQLQATVEQCVALAREDWDSFETSWRFMASPLISPSLTGRTLDEAWHGWQTRRNQDGARLSDLEAKNNRFFIQLYGLAEDLGPEDAGPRRTLVPTTRLDDAAAFLSYVVGCMMGRYSLDRPGLVLADAGDTVENYLRKVGKPLAELTFAPDEDGIVPVLDGDWFEDDIVARTREFLRAAFGEANLRENVRWLEESLGKDLRKYFLTDFYKDHLQTYKKRPIYWMVQSPKKGFAALIYLHRYTRDTMNVLLNRYLRDYGAKLAHRIAQLERQLAADTLPARERTAARKELEKRRKVLRECQEWERDTVLPLAQQRIALDLDDGVKVNYQKLPGALAPIPGLAAADD